MTTSVRAGADVLVVGPGAVGCALAAAALSAGRTVALAGPTPFDELHVSTPDREVRLPVSVITNPHDVGPAPIVVLSAKVNHDRAAADFVRNGVANGGVLAVLQNGITHRERMSVLLGDLIDAVSVVPAVVYCPAERLAPGRVVVRGATRFTLPDDVGGRAIQQALADGYAQVRLTDDWLAAAWTKLMMNAATGAIAVPTRRDNRVFSDPEAADLALGIMEEVAAVARAEGAALADDVPRRALAALQGSASGHVSSIVADRIAGRPTEWAERNLVVVERARRHGIGVPLIELTTTLLRLGEPGGEGDRSAPVSD